MPETETKTSLPILDLSRFDAAGADRDAFLKELREAARDFGFFYLTGHGVSEGLIQSVVGLARRFFALPERQKLEIEMVNSPHFRGYTRPGYEYTRGQQDWREQVDIGAERPALPRASSAPAWSPSATSTSTRPSRAGMTLVESRAAIRTSFATRAASPSLRARK